MRTELVSKWMRSCSQAMCRAQSGWSHVTTGGSGVASMTARTTSNTR
ncbi:MAG: hypothetical protein H6706_25515 [Myxococcales bacterium]|nr:hypothetical protein [Myxococcales bacterium]